MTLIGYPQPSTGDVQVPAKGTIFQPGQTAVFQIDPKNGGQVNAYLRGPNARMQRLRDMR